MKKISTSLLFLLCSFSITVYAQGKTTITLNAAGAKHTISRHIYGHFAEHLGRCIYGGFYVGELNTSIPNVNGVRKDVVDALKKLKIPNLRWPGGCFADTYHWKDGIGPKAQRPKMVNIWWGGVTEDNSFGTHDFLNMCELLGTEPYVAANVGSGTVQELADWVQYVNSATLNPMSTLRQQNGREKPWEVVYWGVGNEAWGCGGNMKPDWYANLYKQYATFMTNYHPTKKLFRIASGANSGDYQWTETLMREIPLNMLEGVALHHYSVIDWNKKGSATAFDEQQYFTTLKRAVHMEELVTRHSTIMDRYDPERKVALVVDEWGGWYDVEQGTNPGFLYQQNTMRDAMIAGLTLNIFNNHAERVRMANLAQTINVLQAVILTDEQKMILTPTYHVMEMYTVHHDAKLIPLSVNTTDYVYANDRIPAVSASASVDATGVRHVSLVNVHATQKQVVTLDFPGTEIKTVNGRILTAAKLQEFNSFEQPSRISPATFKDARISQNKVDLTLPPFSVVVLELR